MLVQGLANKVHVRIGQTGMQSWSTVETFRFNGVANGIGVNVEFTRDSAYFPVLGIKIAADLHARFRVHHLRSLLNREVGGKGSTNRPPRPQTIQRRNGTNRCVGAGCLIVALLLEQAAVDVVPSLLHSAGKLIEREP
jgi:hypothetical protein